MVFDTTLLTKFALFRKGGGGDKPLKLRELSSIEDDGPNALPLFFYSLLGALTKAPGRLFYFFPLLNNRGSSLQMPECRLFFQRMHVTLWIKRGLNPYFNQGVDEIRVPGMYKIKCLCKMNENR